MTSSSFRDSMNSMGWTRREQPATSTSKSGGLMGTLQSLNPFAGEDRVLLPTHEGEGPGAPLPARSRREEEEGWFALSRWDRIMVFVGLNLAAAALFIVCFTLMPLLSLRPNKFAILWTMASILFLASWAVMMGPLVYLRHLVSQDRLPFTATYFGSVGLTLYFAVGRRNGLLTMISSIVQLVALSWYLISYFPMGSQGLRFAASFGTSRVAAWMNG